MPKYVRVHEPSLNKGQVLVRMVQLLQRRGGVAVREIQDRFDLDARTFRRYVADLRDMGVPIEETRQSGQRLLEMDRAYARTGVQLSLAEVLSLHFGRALFTFLDGTSFATDLDDMIERLEPAIPRAAVEAGQHLDRKFMAVPEHAKDYRDDGELLDEVLSALLYENPADAEYRAPLGVPKVYRLEPLTLAVFRQGLYLFARDVAEGKVKTFALERFVRFSRLRREHFPYPPDYDPRRLVRDSFGIVAGAPQEVVALFAREQVPYLRERQWHRSQRFEAAPDGAVRLRMRVAVGPELREWLLGFGPDVKVESPPELADWVRDRHAAAAARYAP